MPRKTGYSTRSASTTLVLGDPDMGTNEWDTEYDVEFTTNRRLDSSMPLHAGKRSARSSLMTPRSLKKGYVSGEDYEDLNDEYNTALSLYRDLQRQVAALEQRMASMYGNEHLLLQAVGEQHGLLDTLRDQVTAMSDSVGRLLTGAERSKSLLGKMTNGQEVSPSKMTYASPKVALEDSDFTSKRLTSLEAKIGDMAEAVTELARAQSLIVSEPRAVGAVPTASVYRRGSPEQPPASVPRSRPPSSPANGAAVETEHEKDRTGRGNALGQRRGLEKIERLPTPIHLTARSTFWKP